MYYTIFSIFLTILFYHIYSALCLQQHRRRKSTDLPSTGSADNRGFLLQRNHFKRKISKEAGKKFLNQAHTISRRSPPDDKRELMSPGLGSKCPAGCSLGWVVVGCRCLNISHTTASWEAASQACRLQQGHLLTINGPQQAEEINKALTERWDA